MEDAKESEGSSLHLPSTVEEAGTVEHLLLFFQSLPYSFEESGDAVEPHVVFGVTPCGIHRIRQTALVRVVRFPLQDVDRVLSKGIALPKKRSDLPTVGSCRDEGTVEIVFVEEVGVPFHDGVELNIEVRPQDEAQILSIVGSLLRPFVPGDQLQQPKTRKRHDVSGSPRRT